MPTFIIKPTPDSEVYVEWSTIVDAPISMGTRQGYLGTKRHDGSYYTNELFDQADVTGTSLKWFGGGPNEMGGWDDPSLIYLHKGSLPRERVLEATARLILDEKEIPDEWLIPFEDDE